jgi:RNA polymerase sigma-70 factor (ECF subfamily)
MRCISSPGEITRLIEAWQRGDKSAENALFDAMYSRLHRLAVQCLRSERPGQTLGATALVHEAYLRFETSERLDIVNRSHFLALAARVMRRVLVDKARARQADRRGNDPAPVELTEALVRTDADAERILAVDCALDELAAQSARLAQLVELRYFAGYTIEESAAVLGLSARTARRDWQVARTRLRVAIDGSTATT